MDVWIKLLIRLWNVFSSILLTPNELVNLFLFAYNFSAFLISSVSIYSVENSKDKKNEVQQFCLRQT